NAGARFSLAGYDKLTTRARSDRTLARAMLRRSDLPRQYFLKLVENASASVRTKLEADMPVAPAAIATAVNNVAATMSEEARNPAQGDARVRHDDRFNARRITEAKVHAPAAAQRFEQTVVALARLGRFPVYAVERALLDRDTDMVLILARAAGCSWTTAKALL